MKSEFVRTFFKPVVCSIIAALILCGNVIEAEETPVPILREGVNFSSITSSSSEGIDKSNQTSPMATASTTSSTPSIITFENGVDGQVIQSGIPGVTFSTTNRQDWLYADIRTGNYNVYPYGHARYRCHGDFFAWLGPSQGRGRIDFTQGPATIVSVKYSSYSTVYLEAYSADGSMLDQDVGSGNLDQPMGTLSLSADSIAYVIFHDTGNYWLIDDVEITLSLVELLNVNIPESNKQNHHTSGYSDFVLRRGETVDVEVRASESYDQAYHTISFLAKPPDGSEIVWTSTPTGTTLVGDEKIITFDVEVPGDAKIGEYELTARLNQANGGTILDTEVCDDKFHIIFNPWSSDDTDVYKASEVGQLNHYVLGKTDWNYYGKTDCSKGADTGFGYCRGAQRTWTMGVTDSSVFAEAMEAVSGMTSANAAYTALRKKVQYGVVGVPESLEGQQATDIIYARWGSGSYKRDWRNVPSIVEASGHPRGQCMDFAGTLTALARSVGVPARMLACIPSGGWDFHCWSEARINEVDSVSWAAIDGTPLAPYYHGFGPTTRNGSLFQYETNGANAVYTYDASSGSRIDIKNLYGVSSSSMAMATFNAENASDVSIVIDLENEPYLIGDDVEIVVAVTNSGSGMLNTELNLHVCQEFYNGTIRELPTFPARSINVPSGNTILETFNISRDVYESQGMYLIIASAGGAVAEERCEIEDGLEVSTNMVLVMGETDLYDVSASVRNILERDIDDLHVEVYFPGSAEVPSNPMTFDPPIVAAGDTATKTWSVRFNERGVTGIVCFAESEDAGYDKANADEEVKGDSKILCAFGSIDPISVGETLTITATIENLGGVTTDVDVGFLVPDALASSVAASQTIVGVTPGEVRQILFDVTALEAGSCAIVMMAEDYKGDSDLAIGAVKIFDVPRNISIGVAPNQVPHDQTSHVSLLITNNTSIPDDVLITSFTSKPGIQYAIFDGNTKILGQPTTVSGNYSKELEIEILPSGGGGTLYITCCSSHDPRASSTTTVEIMAPNQPPTANAGEDQTVELVSATGTAVILNGSGSSDPDSTPGTNDDIVSFDWYEGGSHLASGETITYVFPIESHTITLLVTDSYGETDSDDVLIVVEDTTPPQVEVIVPDANTALQDVVVLTAVATDICEVDELYFYIREPNEEDGVPIGYEGLPGTLNGSTGEWEYGFDTTLLPDGYYVILAKAVDPYGNEGWAAVVPVSIRNWAVLELLPASAQYRAGRTMPVKFSLRIVEAVDPAMPFVYNEKLEIRIYKSSDPGNILQTSLFGDASTDYRISSLTEHYITNFKTAKKSAEYTVEIWRTSKNFCVGSFTFETVKKR